MTDQPHLMMPMDVAPGLQGWADREVPCFDPECPGTGIPERQGDVLYHECDECGSEFNYVPIEQAENACSIGVPEDTRRAFADRFPFPSEGPSDGVPVQLGRKPSGQ